MLFLLGQIKVGGSMELILTLPRRSLLFSRSALSEKNKSTAHAHVLSFILIVMTLCCLDIG